MITASSSDGTGSRSVASSLAGVPLDDARRDGRDDRWLTRGQAVLRALCFVVIPILLTGLFCKWLDPFGPRWRAAIEAVPSPLAMRLPVLFVIALFFFFAGLLRYWVPRLPYGGYASTLPARFVAGAAPARIEERAEAASLYARLTDVRIQRRLEDSLPPESRTEVARRLDAMWAELEAGADDAVRDAAADLRRRAAVALRAQQRAETVRLAVGAGVAGLAALLLRAEAASAYTVLGVSMLPSLAPGDVIVGEVGSYRAGRLPRRGDVVVFRSSAVAISDPTTPPVLVKRVIGLPGDRVRMEGGVPVINGWRVPTCDAGEYVHVDRDGSGKSTFGRVLVEFLDDRAYLTLHTGAAKPFETYRVEPGTVFVLGDSRTQSADSRSWNEGQGGGVPLDALAAKGQWFLTGVALDGRADWGRALRTLDALALAPQAEEFDGTPLRRGIAKCLEARPSETTPPALEIAR